VRRAISNAVDKDLLVEAIFLGVEKRADFLFAPTKPYSDLGLSPFAFDRAKAKRLLDEAGWVLEPGKNVRTKDGRELVVDFCFTGRDALQKAIAEALQGELAKIGLHLNLIGEESDSILRRQKDGEFGMIFNDTWGAPYEPHSMLSSMRAPSHADYQAQIGLPMKAELDEMVGRVLLTTDENQRRELYREILTTLHEQAVYLPLTYKTLVRANTPELQGVEFTQKPQLIPFERMYWAK